MDRVRRLKMVLWSIAGLWFAVAVARFAFGLGATTNLTDAVPWGFWIGFDVVSGVALAAGGFVVCAVVYIFGGEKYHHLAKPAVLTAFLGYMAVVLGLMFDLGLPWNIWHMIVFWNPHSPLFEVGWCVMLYLTVLLLEFSPVPLDRFSPYGKLHTTMLKLRIPLVIAGIALSTLHQSSLGSLFLIMPHHVAPLWYSPLLPILFFISAILLGLYMVMFESHFTSYFYRRKPETEMLTGLGNGTRWLALLYILVRFGDLIVRGQGSSLFVNEFLTWWFWLEILLMAVIPPVLFAIPKVTGGRTGQWIVAFVGVFGVVFNRINIAGVAHTSNGMSSYTPHWAEIVISLGVVAVICLVFLFFLEQFRVWEARPVDPLDNPDVLPEFDKASMASYGAPASFGKRAYSILFVVMFAIGYGLIANPVVHSQGLEYTDVTAARGGDVLVIDGNLDGYGVAFQHAQHIQRLGGEEANCAQCHHMNLPGDKESQCASCHTQMYQSVDAFKHEWHSSPDGGNLSCYQCHAEDVIKSKETAKSCDECHTDLIPATATLLVDDYQAVGYVDAMHQVCISCHTSSLDPVVIDKGIDQCVNCHTTNPELHGVSVDVVHEIGYRAGKFQITPDYAMKDDK
jgi:Ni/Fe-hydrogenase subunit HybB-like protein